MLKAFVVVALLLVVPTSSSASEHCNGGECLHRISATKQLNCGSSDTTREQKDCFSKTYQQADRRLKQVYSRLVTFFELDTAMAAERKRRLSRAEEAWAKFRDTNCEFRSSGRERESQAVFRESCRARMTQERAQELEEFLQRGG